MFGEVYDTTKPFTSQFTTRNRMQAVLDFPFQDAARNFASKGQASSQLQTFFEDDDWYTDANSNVYQLPTFLGNHDMGRIGYFVNADNAGASEDERLARDRLAHELMYFSRGNPVIYYGDEQGFTGSGGDQVARQSMFASQVPDYLDDDLLGTTRTHAQDNFVPSHPLYTKISQLASLAKEAPGSSQRSPSTPIRQHRRWHLCLLPDPARPAARVRGRPEQQRAGTDGEHPDLRPQRRLRPDLRRPSQVRRSGRRPAACG